MALTDVLREMSNEEKWRVLGEFEQRTGVDVPAQPIPRYAPLKSEQVSAMDPDIVTIGAHTMSHPFLSRVSEAEARREIFGSKEVLERELNRSIDLFCYPQGKYQDFSPRDQQFVEEAGFKAAFMTETGDPSADRLNEIPRYGASGDGVHFRWVLCGAEHLFMKLRTAFFRQPAEKQRATSP